MSTLLPELREADATGEKAAIYAEIRRLGAVPMVALVFRHIATLPGGIEWAWGAMGPAWQTGHLQEAAWRVARQAPIEPLADMPLAALRILGVDDQGLDEIRITLAAYNRANPENMLSVLCLARLAGGRAASRPLAARDWTPPPVPSPLVPMGDVTRMSAETAALLDLVAAPGEPGTPRVIQSLYRHFLHRPAFLALAVTLLRQRFDDGSIDRSVAAIREAMNVAADDIVAGLSAPPAPHSGVRTVCDRFGGAVIPQMIVAGTLLERALPTG